MRKFKYLALVLAAVLTLTACQSGTQEMAIDQDATDTATGTQEPVNTEEEPAEQAQAEPAPESAGSETAQVETETQAVGEEGSSDAAQFPVRDKKIPPYELDLIDGSTIRLDQYEGKVVVMAFFTTWCSYCKKEIPALQKQFEEMDDLVVIGVDVNETEAELMPYLEEHGVTFPVFMDSDGQFSQLFYVTGFPTTVFISPEGTLVGSVPGYLETEQLLGYIEYTRMYQPEPAAE